MQDFINFFLGGYSDVQLMAALILSVVLIENIFNAILSVIRLGGR